MEQAHIHHRDDGSSRTLADGWKRIHWPTLSAGAMLGVVFMQLLIARPLTQQITRMHQRMEVIDSHLVDLSGSRDDVRRTNDLLTGLRAQHDHLADAQATVAQLKTMQAEIGVEARKVGASMAALHDLSQLQAALIEKHTGFNQANTALDTIAMVSDRIQAVANTVPTQTAQLKQAEAAIQNLGQLASHVVEHGQPVNQANAALTQLAQMRDQAIATGQQSDSALKAISSLATVTQAATVAGQQTESAVASLQGISELQLAVIRQHDLTIAANHELAAMSTIQQQLIEQADSTPQAQSAVASLVTLKTQIAEGMTGLETAQANTNHLIEINGKLAAQSSVSTAQTNLDGLLKIEQTLTSQTRQIADSVESLQLLSGLQGEFNDQIAKLETIQRGFTELLIMESSVARAVKMVQPLAELGNLRRNSEPEIRAAAREIINRRELRMVEERSKYDEGTPEYNPPVAPVPMPPADSD